MRILRVFCLFAAFFCLLALPVRAADLTGELYAESGADKISEALPDEAREILEGAGIAPDRAEPNAVRRFFLAVSEDVRSSWTEPLRAAVLLTAAVILCRIVREFAPTNLRYTADLCGTLCAACVLLRPIAGLIGQSASVIEGVGAFLLAAVPVYAGLLVWSGNAVTGSTYGALTLAAANLIPALAVNLFVPLLRILLALSAVTAVTSFDLKKLTDSLFKALKWVLILSVTVYTSVLSLQTLISAGADSASGKAAKMIASSAIPIVGGAFSDAFSALAASVSLVKSGVGAFGLLASLAVFLPLCLQAGAWIVVCRLTSFAAELFGLSKPSAFLDGCETALKLLVAVVFSVGAVAVVSAAVMLCVRGAYA